MAVKFKQIAGRVSGLALVLAALSLPAVASAQDMSGEDGPRPEREGRIHGGSDDRPAARSLPAEADFSRGARREARQWSPPASVEAPRQAPEARPVPDSPRTQGEAARQNWNRADGARQDSNRGAWNRSEWNRGEWNRSRDDGQRNDAPRTDGARPDGPRRGGWNGSPPQSVPVAVPQPAPPPPAAAPAPPARSWEDNRGTWSGNRDRRGTDERWRSDRSGSGWNRDGDRRTDRDGNRQWDRDNDRRWDRDNDNRWNRNDNRWDRNDGRYRSGERHDYRRWDNRWRDNKRYNWSTYRRSYPHVYRLPSYYAPYRNYHYRRLSIGFYLDSLFFSNRYWISNPWQYRLPEVYGPYRWVRYYDDALLVNIYSGEVVDVIYSFFW